MGKYEHDDGTDECIDASTDHQNDDQSQNCQYDILKIGIFIDSAHGRQEKM